MGNEMPRKRKKQESIWSLVFVIAFAIFVFWILKMILKIDLPFDDILSNVLWISIAFGAGALYAQVRLISKDVDEVQDKLDKMADEELKEVRDITNQIKEVRDITNQIKGRLGIP
jgi:5-bromo-4-chloroindolyl phosphate hydrolysis protein